MNPTLLLASIAAAIIGSAQAGYIYIYSPYASSHCKPGLPCPISWNVSHEGPEFSRVDIELLSGEAHNANVVSPVVLGYELSQGNTYVWNVPQGIKPEDDYFIRIRGVGTDYVSYSHTFPIGFEPKPVTTTGTATGTATTGTLVPTHTASRVSSTSTEKKSSTAAIVSTSTSGAKSVQSSMSVAAVVVAAAIAAMMF